MHILLPSCAHGLYIGNFGFVNDDDESLHFPIKSSPKSRVDIRARINGFVFLHCESNHHTALTNLMRQDQLDPGTRDPVDRVKYWNNKR